MGKGLINVGFTRLGRRFVDPDFRQKGLLSSAQGLARRAKRQAVKNRSEENLVLLDEAFARAKLLDATEVRNDIDGQRRELIESTYPDVDFALFQGLRINAYLAMRGVGKVDLITKLYKDLFDRFPVICQEQLAADLFQLAIFEGYEKAFDILRSLKIRPESFNSSIVDLMLAKEVNPTLDITAENLALIFYASGLWKEPDFGSGMVYAKLNGILLNWILQASGLTRSQSDFLRLSFVPNGYSHSYPRGLVYFKNESIVSFRELTLPVYPRVIASLQKMAEITGKNTLIVDLTRHDAFLHIKEEFLAPAITALKAEIAAA